MKNVIFIFILAITTIGMVAADETTIILDYGEPIIIQDLVIASNGTNCLTCDCNATLYYPNGTQIEQKQMTMLGNGVYNATFSDLEPNTGNEKYPVIMKCNDGIVNGFSTITNIKVIPTAFDFTSLILIPIAISLLLIYAAFKVDKEHFMLKWTFLNVGVLFFIAFSVLGSFISDSYNNEAIKNFFVTLIYLTGFIFIYTMYYMISTFIKFNKNSEDKQKRGY